MKSRNWLGSHRRMFHFYGGVPHVTVPDCLKQGVLKCHLYDPDLNPGYAQLAGEFSTAVVPARPGHPKDKAIVEGLVKILMRYARFPYRRTRFTSLAQINEALGAASNGSTCVVTRASASRAASAEMLKGALMGIQELRQALIR